MAKRLRRKLGDDPNNPKCIFAEPRVGYRMPKGETEKREGGVSGVGNGKARRRYPLAFLLPVTPHYLWSGPR